jgi:class 3 adenylate cyclase
MITRATATILFTDLVGSTELRSRLGDTATEALRRRHDDALAKAVTDHGGRVVKGLGDGVMASFAGASDAVAAAVAIQQAIDRLNRSGKAPAPLEVRVGLSAGDVTIEEDDVHGTPVIETSRLCGAAQGGEVLAAELVRALAGSNIDCTFVPVGPLELKGLPAVVPAVRVGWEPFTTSSIRMPTLLTDLGRIFVGRDSDPSAASCSLRSARRSVGLAIRGTARPSSTPRRWPATKAITTCSSERPLPTPERLFRALPSKSTMSASPCSRPPWPLSGRERPPFALGSSRQPVGAPHVDRRTGRRGG